MFSARCQHGARIPVTSGPAQGNEPRGSLQALLAHKTLETHQRLVRGILQGQGGAREKGLPCQRDIPELQESWKAHFILFIFLWPTSQSLYDLKPQRLVEGGISRASGHKYSEERRS